MTTRRQTPSSRLEALDTPFSSQLYWLGRNTGSAFQRWARRHRRKLIALGCLAVLLLFVSRVWLQPLALAARINAFPILVSALALVGAVFLFTQKRFWWGFALLLVNLGLIVCFLALDGKPRDFLGLYWRQITLQREEASSLPITRYERIQPLNSIRTLAKEAMTEVEQVSEPSYARIGDEYFWTMAVEPSFLARRLTGRIREVINVSASAPSPNFSSENRASVSFLNGEDLLLGRSLRSAIIKTFDPWRYFNYAVGEPRYAKDGQGNWVQLVSLIKWEGFLFPRPVFGGVVVVKEKRATFLSWTGNFLFGSGTWIRPKEVEEHGFLKGQNIVPPTVSRFAARSFRFQKGFWAPMPGYHLGDVRIPDLPGDFNDQPFAAYFDFGDGDGKPYHYFALEPYQKDKQGLSTSVFFPADGIGPTKFYRHHDKGEALTGVSAIVPKVMESRKNYDWTRNSAAEQRPYIRDIAGRRRFFWLTTVVTFKDALEKTYIAGAVPDVTLTDATYKAVVWVNPFRPGDWEAELSEALGTVWESD